MAEEQSELQMHIANLRARITDFKELSQPLSAADVADVIEESAGALTAVHAELKTIRLK